ncbi:hypothetical protein OH77DRAFT_1578883 [Trametes cingulata]|nr:hypothetical protein OH77DRAFT_1578883 [Trametes cingulata]
MSRDSPPALEAWQSDHDDSVDQLTIAERWWRDHEPWLAERGYALRPRYKKDWKPSWKAHPDRFAMDFEDWYASRTAFILDATRVSDNSSVVLKRVKKSTNPREVEIIKHLSSDDLKSDPRNHTVPLLDVFLVPDDPDVTILVMPLLRPRNDPPWSTVGEVIAFLSQIFQGLQFMHEKNIAHRDCQGPNIMFDPRPMYPNMFHPRVQDKTRDWKGKAKHSTRTACPVKYYYIDFGISYMYNPDDGPPREHPIRGGDKSVPEFQAWCGEPLDPFPTDIYYLGNMIRMDILEPYKGMEFLSPLVDDMVQSDPSKRPIIQDVVRRFQEMSKTLGRRTLRSRLVPRGEDALETFARNVAHAFRTTRFILTRRPAIPQPS